MKKLKHWLNSLSNKTAKRLSLGMLALGLLLFLLALWLNLGAGGGGTTLTTYAMGSYVQQTVYGGDEEGAAQAANTAITELEDLISWRVEGSDVEQLNQAAGTDFLEIDQRTWNVLRTSLDVCQASGGAFDITIAPISWLWDFDEDPHLPQAEHHSRPCCPRSTTRTSPCWRTAPPPFKPTAPPWTWGRWARAPPVTPLWTPTKEAGVDRAVVSVGGSVGVYGEKPGRPALDQSPCGTRTRRALWGPSPSASGFLSTSGSYEKQFTEDGVTYHHLLDPDTGYPAESGLLSVTVWSGSGTLSDALSTACFVLGLEDSLPVLEQFDSERGVHYRGPPDLRD